ncbi:SAM-dependent methyltransferase [Auritidibacter ignavus]|uniref:hypothetical protein n=1 Tax=Auritidibacter ignavus TaxID=678932 RepID=UPI00109C2A68|nr:hypothetical protein [Auritidibacter ignavus]
MNPRSTHSWQIAPPEDTGREAIFLPSVGEYPIYDDTAYEFMLNDERRMTAFRQELDSIITSESTVVELGAGSFAPWARHAVDLGAARVIAVEVIPEVREHLTQTLAADPRYNGIEVLSEEQYHLAQIETDILVSEVVGAIGSSEGALRVVGREIKRLDNRQLQVLPQGWVTKVTAFSWRRVLRGATPRFAAAADPYLGVLQELLGSVDPRLCLVGPSYRLGIMSDSHPVETARFHGRFSQLHLGDPTLTVQRDGSIDSLLLTVEVNIGSHVVSSMNQSSSWLPVVVPLSQDPVSVTAGDELFVSMLYEYETHPLCPDYIIIWKLIRDGVEVISGTEFLPWQPPEGIGQSSLHSALSTKGT